MLLQKSASIDPRTTPPKFVALLLILTSTGFLSKSPGGSTNGRKIRRSCCGRSALSSSTTSLRSSTPVPAWSWSSTRTRATCRRICTRLSVGYTGTGGACTGIPVYWYITRILEGPFSAVSKPIFSVEGLCCRLFQAPQDWHALRASSGDALILAAAVHLQIQTCTRDHRRRSGIPL